MQGIERARRGRGRGRERGRGKGKGKKISTHGIQASFIPAKYSIYIKSQ